MDKIKLETVSHIHFMFKEGNLVTNCYLDELDGEYLAYHRWFWYLRDIHVDPMPYDLAFSKEESKEIIEKIKSALSFLEFLPKDMIKKDSESNQEYIWIHFKDGSDMNFIFNKEMKDIYNNITKKINNKKYEQDAKDRFFEKIEEPRQIIVARREKERKRREMIPNFLDALSVWIFLLGIINIIVLIFQWFKNTFFIKTFIFLILAFLLIKLIVKILFWYADKMIEKHWD